MDLTIFFSLVYVILNIVLISLGRVKYHKSDEIIWVSQVFNKIFCLRKCLTADLKIVV